MFKKPNFFIIGAPKCGTTSLAAWLSEHPQIFISDPKEPAYFEKDRHKAYSVDLARYESYFEHVKDQQIAIGEATTTYLRSKVAIGEILKYSPEALFVVGLRNPIEMAMSWHGQMMFEAWENEYDFERAWRMQEERFAGKALPRLCPDVHDLLYGEVCSLGAQMSRLYSIVPRERVFVYTLDDMRVDTRDLWLRLLDFLGVVDDGRNNFTALNEAKILPLPLRITTRVVADLKQRLGLHKYGFGILTRLNRILAKKRSVEITKEFNNELINYFRDDILLLAEVTGRDFSAWLNE